jgi:hypothetical protein
MLIPHEHIGLRFLSPFYRRPQPWWRRYRDTLVAVAWTVAVVGVATALYALIVRGAP